MTEPDFMTTQELTRDEKFLLLFLETQAVDFSGQVGTDHMNVADFAIAERWSDAGYVRFGRIPAKLCSDRGGQRRTHWVILSRAAMADAAILRAARATRGIARLRDMLAPYRQTAVAAPAFEPMDEGNPEHGDTEVAE